MKIRLRTRRRAFGASAAFAALALLVIGTPGPAASASVVSGLSVDRPSPNLVTCDSTQYPLVVPQHVVDNNTVGETGCQIDQTTTTVDVHGNTDLRVTIGLSGTASGYADPITVGNTRKDIVATGPNGHGPDILFSQFGVGEYVPTTATYSGKPVGTPGAPGYDAGAGLDLLFPPKSGWNGRMIVVTHGQGDDIPMTALGADLVPRHIGGGADPQQFTNLFSGLFLDEGYAVAYIRRPAAGGSPGGTPLVPATLTMPDGTTLHLPESLNDYQPLLTDFTMSSINAVKQVYGRAPAQILYYGHSAANILASVYQLSDSNVLPNGHELFAGFLLDDLGGGLVIAYGPPQGQVLGVKDNQVTLDPQYLLERSRAEQDKFAPMIMLGHADYVDVHTWLPGVTYLRLKETVEKIYQQVGLGDKTRLYVIPDVSHVSNQVGSPPHTLDLGGVVAEQMEVLSLWANDRTIPAPSEFNAQDVGGRNMPGVPNALTLPQSACPTGYWYPAPFPNGASSSTGFVLFNGFAGQTTNQEAINAAGVLEDYPPATGNGFRNPLPTLDQVWQSLGLVRAGGHVTAVIYERCIAHQARMLVALHLLTPQAAQQYDQQAALFPNGPLTGVG